MTELAVVVASVRPSERLRPLLAALAEQDCEVVVVSEHPPPVGFGVHHVPRTERFGPARARNLGWRSTPARWVAFTDDDCVPAPGWAAALLAAAEEDVVVQGRVEPDRPGPLGAFARSQRVDAAGPWFQTANVLYPRALLERLGGFDEDAFPGVAGEDTDLAWRALAAGARPRFAPDALVRHAVVEHGALALARDARRWSSGPRVVARHPGLRAHLHHRVFWRASHERLLLVALALRAGPLPALAAAAWWAKAHRPAHPSRGSLLRSLPGHALVDAAEIAALAEGSARARTLLL